MDTSLTQNIFLLCVIALNIFSFGMMLLDKHRSQRNGQERIPEGILFFLATVGGSLGLFTAMLLIRHKIRKWYFMLGVPLLMAQNAACLYLLAQAIN